MSSSLSVASVQVVAVKTFWQRREFLQLPWKIYKNDPHWIPPLRTNQKEMLNYIKHPFYDDAQIQTFLAYKDGQVVGRVAAIVNQAHNRKYNDKLGFFGFFESIDDTAVSRALFTAAWEWLKERGMTSVRGPVNPSLNYECGLLIDGFDSPPTFMMTHNWPYYAKLIEDFGFAKSQDLYAYWGHVDQLRSLDQKLAFVVEECKKRFSVNLRQLDTKKFSTDVKLFLDIYNRSLVGTWGFVPMSDAELNHAAGGLKMLIVPEMTTIAEIEGKPVGAVFGLLDYNPRIKLIDGRLFPFGFIRLLWNRRAIKRVRMISTNVLPEYQKWGVGLLVVARLVPDVQAWGIQEAEFSWVLESNTLSAGTLKRGGAKIVRTYRLYDYAPTA